jgi:c-di-GMP-binding flagellar brake protein YcgR
MYIPLAIVLLFIAIIVIFFVTTQGKKQNEAPERIDRRKAYRLHVKNKVCNIQPLFSSSREPAVICDISATGIRIETKANSLADKSLLLIYFHLDDETFIVEGIVKRKQSLNPNRDQYGVKFIFLNDSMEETLHKKITKLNRQMAQ